MVGMKARPIKGIRNPGIVGLSAKHSGLPGWMQRQRLLREFYGESGLK
jgi:hypothetical protein